MSRFRAVIQALRGPLDFARDHPDRIDRLANAETTLADACTRALDLDIPPEAKRRFSDVAQIVETAALTEASAKRILERLGPLLDETYPRRALALSTERVPGVGPKIAQTLHRKEISCIEDLLFFLPRSYEDRRELVKIEDLQVGLPACFVGTVIRAAVVPLRNGRRFFQVVVGDGTASVQLKWFRGVVHFQDRIQPGQRLLVAGEVRRYRYSKELHHPEIEVLSGATPEAGLARIVPTYSSVEGVPPRTLRRIVEAAVQHAADLVDAYLPEATVRELALPEVGESLREVHAPGVHLDPEELRGRRTPYHLRLVTEELFLLQAGLTLRRERRRHGVGVALPATGIEVARAKRSLPFSLTQDQQKAWSEIAADLARPQPMNRLLVGDVGTGKTVLAVLGCVAAHAAGGLSAVIAPTEILAEQHLRSFRALAEPLGLRVALLTGSTPAAERRSLVRLLRLGEVSVVVGTHALLTKSLELPNLRLAVIDEQHRFGVAQRRTLGSKGEFPHVLAMSATPIPRSLSLVLFGDLDHSTLRERPPGRAPVTTRVVPPTAGRQAFDATKATLLRGEQVYVVYPLVEESEKQDLQDASRGFERLRRALRGARVGLVHGRLDAAERTRTMSEFSAGKLDVLVSTTVIEVGVDVPRATLLVVQHAERFGLAQLHQLRGRVGRGDRPGTAILIADPKSEDAARRLAILERSASGFDIAEEDLAIRGAGEWLGTRQAGHLPELRLADLVRHAELLPIVRQAAERLIERDPGLEKQPELRAGIDQRWGRRLALGAVG
jgi:ATP-dependent DNA helicase RecG